MSAPNDNQTDKELLDYGQAELWEWSYEVYELTQKLNHDTERGDVYEYTAMLRAIEHIGGVAAKSYSRWWRSRKPDEWRYQIGDQYIVKLVGPIGRKSIEDDA